MTLTNQEIKLEIYEYLKDQDSPVTVSHIQANLCNGYTNQKICALLRQLQQEGCVSRQEKNGLAFWSAKGNMPKIEQKTPTPLECALAKIDKLEKRIAELEQQVEESESDNYYSSSYDTDDSGLFMGFGPNGPIMGFGWKI